MENELPKRKPTRLKNFDYSSIGAYFVTVCTKDRMPILSDVIREISVTEDKKDTVFKTKLTNCGKIVEYELLALESRYSNITIDGYVIMPDHIHFVVMIHRTQGGGISPTLSDAVCVFKSLATRKCKEIGIDNLFQRSFAEHIVRNSDDYETRIKYIYENPMRWYYKRMVDAT